MHYHSTGKVDHLAMDIDNRSSLPVPVRHRRQLGPIVRRNVVSMTGFEGHQLTQFIDMPGLREPATKQPSRYRV